MYKAKSALCASGMLSVVSAWTLSTLPQNDYAQNLHYSVMISISQTNLSGVHLSIMHALKYWLSTLCLTFKRWWLYYSWELDVYKVLMLLG